MYIVYKMVSLVWLNCVTSASLSCQDFNKGHFDRPDFVPVPFVVQKDRGVVIQTLIEVTEILIFALARVTRHLTGTRPHTTITTGFLGGVKNGAVYRIHV